MPARILSLRHHITPAPLFCHDTFRHVRIFDARAFYVACNFETNGDGAKMSDEGQNMSLIGHLRTHTPLQAGTPALPRPHWFQCVPVLRIVVFA